MPRGFFRPHAGHRLVEQQQARPGRQRHGDFKLAALAVAEFGDRHVGALREADASKRVTRRLAQFALAPRVAPEAERMAGMGLDRERDIVERGEFEKQRGDLKRAREPELAAPIDRQRA